LDGYSNFRSINGRAEATTLADQALDFVTAGQAFHWFEPQPTRVEFGRILRSGGWVVLVWNTRLTHDGGLMSEYEALLDRYALDYHEINHSEQNDDVPGFFDGAFQARTFANEQQFDFAGMAGRLLSSSYAPPASHPHYEPLLVALRRLFDHYQRDGRVSFRYKTEMFYGRP